jgi:hypothetical protein
MTGNPNLAGGHDYEFAILKLIRMFLQHGVEMFDFGLQVSTWESKENDPGVQESLVEDQLAEVAVSNEQNALLVPGYCQDILISKTGRVLAGDSRNVVAKLTKVRDKAEISALVEEEFHTGVASDRAPLGGFGETSSPVTIAFA